jgi:hypothetical protein
VQRDQLSFVNGLRDSRRDGTSLRAGRERRKSECEKYKECLQETPVGRFHSICLIHWIRNSYTEEFSNQDSGSSLAIAHCAFERTL